MTGPSDLTEQKERVAVLLNDRALVRKDTMQSRASAEADEVRGRFAQINKATVVGTTAAPPDYAAPNWAHDPTGVEPPLGFDVNEVPLCGEAFEIERSLQAHCNDAEGGDDVSRILAMPSPPNSIGDAPGKLTPGAGAGAAAVGHSLSAAAPSTFRKRKF